jgi:hypothetical protein
MRRSTPSSQFWYSLRSSLGTGLSKIDALASRHYIACIIMSLVVLCAPAARANANIQGWCESGNIQTLTSALPSTNVVQGSFPQCTVTVYAHGGGLATIYADNVGTPLSNPFTATTTGRWLFYVSTGRYDVQLSGAGFPSVVTYSDIVAFDPTAPSFPFLTLLGTLSTPEINGIVYVDGNVYPLTAAGINAADAFLGANPGMIMVSYPGSYCSTQVLLSNGHTLQFLPGLYQLNIAGADSTTTQVTWGVLGSGVQQTTLQSCPGSNLDVITDQHFSSLTGTNNFYGVYHPVIQNLTIDGNKSNEAAGYGIRLYGRAAWPNNVLTVNAANDGQWWEWGGTESDTGSSTIATSFGANLESDYNGGNGFSIKQCPTCGSPGPLQAVTNMVGHNNGGWGIQTNISFYAAMVNFYENPSGGCDVQALGDFIVANAQCDTGTGWGLLQEVGAGQVNIAGGNLAGGIPFESRTDSGGQINALMGNAATGGPCMKINGGGDLIISAIFVNCSYLIDFASEVYPSQISAIANVVPTANFQGTPSNGDYINIYNPFSIASRYMQLPAAGVKFLGNSFSNIQTCNSSNFGEVASIFDSPTNVWGAAVTVGGGSSPVMLFCDGSTWTVMAK